MMEKKICITCGKEFEDYSGGNFHTNVCQDCFAEGCREVDEHFEKSKRKVGR